jgi:flagellar hook-length control protein FliK
MTVEDSRSIQPKFAAPSVAPPVVHTKPDAPAAPQAIANRDYPGSTPSQNPAPSTHAASAARVATSGNDAGAPAFALPQSTAPATPAFIHAVGFDSSQSSTNTPPGVDVPVRLAAATPGDPSAEFTQLALHVAAKSAGGDSHFLVRLDPPELGRVEVNLNVDSQGNAHAALSAEEPKTLDLLQRDAPALERALKDAGLDLASGLSFSLKNGGGSGQRSADDSPRTRALRIDAAGDVNASAAPATLFQRNWGAANTRLDITV